MLFHYTTDMAKVKAFFSFSFSLPNSSALNPVPHLFTSIANTQPKKRRAAAGRVPGAWIFQCAGIWIRVIRKSVPGDHARGWRVRQERTFLWRVGSKTDTEYPCPRDPSCRRPPLLRRPSQIQRIKLVLSLCSGSGVVIPAALPASMQ